MEKGDKMPDRRMSDDFRCAGSLTSGRVVVLSLLPVKSIRLSAMAPQLSISAKDLTCA